MYSAIVSIIVFIILILSCVLVGYKKVRGLWEIIDKCDSICKLHGEDLKTFDLLSFSVSRYSKLLLDDLIKIVNTLEKQIKIINNQQSNVSDTIELDTKKVLEAQLKEQQKRVDAVEEKTKETYFDAIENNNTEGIIDRVLDPGDILRNGEKETKNIIDIKRIKEGLDRFSNNFKPDTTQNEKKIKFGDDKPVENSDKIINNVLDNDNLFSYKDFSGMKEDHSIVKKDEEMRYYKDVDIK